MPDERRSAPEAFERFAAGIEPVDREAAALLRSCGADAAVLELLPAEVAWDVPKRVLAAGQWLVLTGAVPDYRDAPEPFAAMRAALLDHPDEVARFVHERSVQTNEVQRCFALLPIFLTVSQATGRPLDLVELGASAGLNLLWDRYRYRYRGGIWGSPDATLELTGEERSPVPSSLLTEVVEVRHRIGIDLNPLDLKNNEDVAVLRSYTGWPRQERLVAAIEVARHEPPILIRGDYLTVLPDLLAQRSDDALTVVYQTISTIYIDLEDRHRLREVIQSAGSSGPLAWISTPTPEEHGQRRGDYPIELAIWPDANRRIVARMDNAGEWIEWCD